MILALLGAPACSSSADEGAWAATPTTVAAAPTATTTTTTTVPPTTVPPPPTRSVSHQAWTPFATVAGITLFHPSSRVERVGFHQSNHEGAQQLEVLPTAVSPVTLEGRERLTGSHTSADIVVDPGVEIRAPATGTVNRAGTYVLYCKYSDDYLVIDPDGHPPTSRPRAGVAESPATWSDRSP